MSFTAILQQEANHSSPKRVPLAVRSPKSAKKTPAKSQTPSSSSAKTLLSPTSQMNAIFAPLNQTKTPVAEEKRKSLPATPNIKIPEIAIVAETVPKDVKLIPALEGDSSEEEGVQEEEQPEEDICARRVLATPIRNEIKEAKQKRRRRQRQKLSTPIRKQIEGFQVQKLNRVEVAKTSEDTREQQPVEELKDSEARQTTTSAPATEPERVVTPQLPRKLKTPLRIDIHKRRKSYARTRDVQQEDKPQGIRIVEVQSSASPVQSTLKEAKEVVPEAQEDFKQPEEDEEVPVMRRMPTPMRKEIALKKKCFTPAPSVPKIFAEVPFEESTSFGATQRELFPGRKLQTPVKKAIENGVQLRTKQILQSPIRRQIQQGVQLKKKKQMPLELKTQILAGYSLKTKKKLKLEIQQQIQRGLQLRQKRRMNTQLKAQIENGVQLKPKKRINADLKTAIENGVQLKKKRKMMTPMKTELLIR